MTPLDDLQVRIYERFEEISAEYPLGRIPLIEKNARKFDAVIDEWRLAWGYFGAVEIDVGHQNGTISIVISERDIGLLSKEFDKYPSQESLIDFSD